MIFEKASTNDNLILASIILPAFNEEQALPKVLEDLCNILDQRYELIVVDDGSTDKTAEVARWFDCNLIQHVTNQGKGQAVNTGIKSAHGKYVIIMDADATYPASEITNIVKLLEQYDLVRCIRQYNQQNMPRMNEIGNHFFDWLFTSFIGLNGKDQLSGLYGIRRANVLQMDLEASGFDLEAEINYKAREQGLKIFTFPVEYKQRIGKKKLKPLRDGFTILNRVMTTILLYHPEYTFVLTGIIVMVFALILAVTIQVSTPLVRIFHFSYHSLILASLGVLAGFQLMTFGLVASLYGLQKGLNVKPWLVKLSAGKVRFFMILSGFIMISGGFFTLFILVLSWIFSGGGEFKQTWELVSSAVFLVLGLQILSAALFISIFVGRIKDELTKTRPAKNHLSERDAP